MLHPEEVPKFRERVVRLLKVGEKQLQPLKLSRDDPGDHFGKHSDQTVSHPKAFMYLNVETGFRVTGDVPPFFYDNPGPADKLCEPMPPS